MKYKAYEQNPHTALLEIKQAFDDEKPYKAQSLCLAYFTYLENQRHITTALDYHAKDDVYKYVIKQMNGKNDKVKYDHYIESYKLKIEQLRKDSKEFTESTAALKQFCESNGLDLDSLTEQFLQKSLKTREQLIEANKAVNERQAGKVAKSEDSAPQPNPEEYRKLMEDAAKFNEELASSLTEKLSELEEELF